MSTPSPSPPPSRRRAAVARWALAAAVLVQLVVLYAPRAPSTGGAPGVDKAVHLLVFAAVAVTGRAAGVRLPLLVGLLLAHAVVSEAVQHWLLPGRSGDWRDAVADAAGVLVGVLAGALLPVPSGRSGGRMVPWRARGPAGRRAGR